MADAPTTTAGVMLGLLRTTGPAAIIGGLRIPPAEQRAALDGIGVATDGAAGVRTEWLCPGGDYHLGYYSTDRCWLIRGPGLGKGRAHRLTHGDAYATALPCERGRVELRPGGIYALLAAGDRWELRQVVVP